ncbi:urease accessory protein UreD [Marinomonas mediterranea]|uniref:urease accessory protein UreD n=1 Tax=Marinomonas mediterranea TaxID=119864 RepID=UPI002349C95E|nr:urease accessory protein UreD [Marinomonas mediterranea]WCN11620.1 urease accessory protein UreD [Marinomonas mediterranea]
MSLLAEPMVSNAGERTLASQWKAYLKIGFDKTARGTVLKTCDHKGPLYVQKPFYPEGKEAAHVYLLHPPGGLVSGDELVIESKQSPDTHVLITTPGAGRVYKARPDKTLQRQTTLLNVAKGSVMEWLPQETILYPDANTKLTNRIDLQGSARFIGWEITCFGLPANQKDFNEGKADQRIQINVDGRIRLRERLLIDKQSRDLMSGQAGLQANPVNGVLIAGPFTEQSEANDALMDTLKQACRDMDGVSGATLVGEFVVIRSLNSDSERMKNLFIQCWRLIRPALLGKAACEPRIWST